MKAIDRSVPETPANFTRIFPEVPDMRPTAPGQARPQEISEEIRQCQEIYLDINKRLRIQGVMPITILNFNPFPLKPDGVVFGGLEIPGIPEDEDPEKWTVQPFVSLENTDDHVPYVRYSFRSILFSIADKGGAMFLPREHVPVQVAGEINRQFFDIGGVLAYYNDVPVSDQRALLRFDELDYDQEPSHDAVEARLKAVQKVMLKTMLRLVQTAENEFNRPNRQGWNNINEQHRRAARYLLNRHRLAKTPSWLVKESDPNAQPLAKDCPVCRTKAATEAVKCACGYFFDVVVAYDAGMVDDTDHKTLRRMTIADLEARGLDPEISTEYRRKNLKKKKKHTDDTQGE